MVSLRRMKHEEDWVPEPLCGPDSCGTLQSLDQFILVQSWSQHWPMCFTSAAQSCTCIAFHVARSFQSKATKNCRSNTLDESRNDSTCTGSIRFYFPVEIRFLVHRCGPVRADSVESLLFSNVTDMQLFGANKLLLYTTVFTASVLDL